MPIASKAPRGLRTTHPNHPAHPRRLRYAARTLRAVRLRGQGWTHAAIAADLGVCRQAVTRMLREAFQAARERPEEVEPVEGVCVHCGAPEGYWRRSPRAPVADLFIEALLGRESR